MDLHSTKKVQFLFRKELKNKYQIEKRTEKIIKNHKTTPSGNLAKLILDFSQTENIQSFKENQKKLRKLLKDQPSLYTNIETEPLILDLALAFCKESTLGQISDIKGIINDFIDAVFQYENYITQVKKTFNGVYNEFLLLGCEFLPRILAEVCRIRRENRKKA